MLSSSDTRKDQVDSCNDRGELVGKARQPDVCQIDDQILCFVWCFLIVACRIISIILIRTFV